MGRHYSHVPRQQLLDAIDKLPGRADAITPYVGRKAAQNECTPPRKKKRAASAAKMPGKEVFSRPIWGRFTLGSRLAEHGCSPRSRPVARPCQHAHCSLTDQRSPIVLDELGKP